MNETELTAISESQGTTKKVVETEETKWDT